MTTPNATVAQYGGSAAAVFFGLTANELAALGGLVIGLIGLIYNIYDKHRRFQLEVKRLDQEKKQKEVPYGLG